MPTLLGNCAGKAGTKEFSNVLTNKTKLFFYNIANGAAATQASALIRHKCASFSSSHIFVPVAVETLGAWDGGSLSFIRN